MLSIVLAALLSVVPLGTYGNLYDIKEKDAFQEIEERAKDIDTSKIELELREKFNNYRPRDMAKLEPARKSYSYPVEMRHVLDYDIPRVDGEGKIVGVLYPKGHTYNPVEFLPADPSPMVVFDGKSRKEVSWVKYYYGNRPGFMLVMTQGDWVEVSKEMGQQVYYLKRVIVDKLNLKNTVSVVYRKGKNMQVDVYAVK
jgi:conjugal transfer pilus assembly protein TraW